MCDDLKANDKKQPKPCLYKDTYVDLGRTKIKKSHTRSLSGSD